MKKVFRTIHMLIWGAVNSYNFREVRFVVIRAEFTNHGSWAFHLYFYKPRLYIPHFLEVDYCRSNNIVVPFDEIPF